MLVELQIQNFAIIDRIRVSFGAGFSVLTGETGAGKSIIIDAVGLLLGDRARPEMIRSEAEEATVEAVFDLAGQALLKQDLAAAGFPAGEDELLVRRTISRSGRNRVYLNGGLATLGQLQSFTARLVSIYGQHEHQSLQRAETHLGLLDAFGGLQERLARYRDAFERCRTLEERLTGLEASDRERRERLEFISFQARELEAAAPQAGEDEQLEGERRLLQNAERLLAATAGGFESLYGAEDAVCGRVDQVAEELEALAAVDPLLGELAESLRSAQYATEDVAARLRDYGRRVDFEPERQAEVEARLAVLAGLKRKYGPGLAEVLARQAEITADLEELADVDGNRRVLQEELEGAREEVRTEGERLGAARRAAARELTARVEAELADLAMERARFEVRFLPRDNPAVGGLERVAFFLAPNPGEEPKALAKIASGGELSRIMLALRRAAPEGEEVAALVFDEVDAGIGGAAATAVGEKLRGLADRVQVLCITHLPQVAACADHHFRVEKHTAGGRTVTSLARLDSDERIREMARMLGGARITDRTLEHARELIGQAPQRGAAPAAGGR